MFEATDQNLSGVPQTMLITLYLRAMETQRPDALIKDEKAVELVTRLGYDFERIRRIPMNDANRLAIILRNRQIDRYAQDFLMRHPDAVVVHIGCGLDARFERVAEGSGQVEWYDLDFPQVIEMHRRFVGDDRERYHLLACSVLDNTWLDTVGVHRPRPFLFLAEGVFMYLREAQAKSLVLTLRDHFPGAELVFDTYSPTHVWLHNFQIGKLGGVAGTHWGIWHGEELERWGDPSTSLRAGNIRLLDEWGMFDRPERRLAHFRWWLRPIDALFRTLRVYHFRLG
jgi:O-methyltransferase involved in polyketide biosynthesis